MSTRVANLAANNQIVDRIMRTQNRVHESEIKVSTGSKSQDYIGIANESGRLVNLENSRTLLESYTRNNNTMELRLDTATTSIESIESTIKDFRLALSVYSQSTTNDAQSILNLQNTAVRSMKTMEAYLNTEADGRFIFSGSRVSTEPVNFNFTNLTEFQALYDGTAVTYPTTSATNIHPKLTATTGFPSNPTGAGYGNLTFTDATETITAATAGAFANIPAGSKITVTGTAGAAYDTTFTVSTNDGTNMVVSPVLGAGDLAGQTAVTITVNTSYYKGDERTLSHRADNNRNFTYDMAATQPAFEKAIRAMGIIAQGGLATNAGRVDQAKYLVDTSLFSTVSAATPAGLGTELAGSIEGLSHTNGFLQVLLDQIQTSHATNINFLGRNISDIENADPLESIAQLTSDTRALEASYRALARVRELGLQDFIS